MTNSQPNIPPPGVLPPPPPRRLIRVYVKIGGVVKIDMANKGEVARVK